MAHIKEISIGYPRQRKEIKITFPGGIVNVHCGLSDRDGREVVNVSVSANGDRYAGDPQWWAHWGDTDERGGGVRIIQHEKETETPEVRQTACRHCGLDIEGFAPYRKGEWRDRGNNTHCPDESKRAHAPEVA